MPQVRIMALLIYVVTEGQTLLVHCSNILNFFFFGRFADRASQYIYLNN